MVASVNPRAAGVTAVPSVTWAELRALNPASYNPSQIFHVSDVGVGGSYWYSNGVRWVSVNSRAMAKRQGLIRLGRAPDATGVASTTLRTTQQAWRVPFDVYGFQIGLESNLAAATTFSLCKAAIIGSAGNTLTQALDDVANASSATPFSVTWGGGSAGATVPARTALDAPAAITWSDTIYQKIQAGQVLVERMLWPYPGSAWNYPYAATGLSSAEFLAANPALATMHWHNTTDQVTGWTSWATNSSNGSGNLSVQYLRLLTAEPVITVAAIGDSTLTGQVNSGSVPLAPVWAACEALSASGLRFVPYCRGWGGKEPSTFYNYALDIINATIKPDVLIWQAWSQNDTAQTVNVQEIALTMDIVSRCRAAGIVPIVVTGIPINSWVTPTYDSQEAARVALNALIRSAGEIIIDADAVISNGVTPVADYNASYGTDQHPNAAGYAALVLEYINALKQVGAR